MCCLCEPEKKCNLHAEDDRSMSGARKPGELHVPHDDKKEHGQQYGSEGKEQVCESDPDHLLPDHLRQFSLRARRVIGVAVIETHLCSPQRSAYCQEIASKRGKE